MRARVWIGIAVAALIGATSPGTASQDDEAPPAIAQWGIANYASRIQSGWSGGSIARGSLVRIRGWRLGPSKNLTIDASTKGKPWSLTPIASSGTEIEALVPHDAPLGAAQLHIVKDGKPSLDWPVTVVAASFGAFSRNQTGWGPGEVFNADGAANSEERPARPGETVRLLGSGLGAGPIRAPQILLGGRVVPRVREARRVPNRPGVDELVFEIPPDAPTGCYVPIQAVSGPGVYSNAVTLAIGAGGHCGGGADALAATARQAGGSAVAILAHGDVLLELSPTIGADYPMDAVYASFFSTLPGEPVNPMLLSPPLGACTPFTGPTRTLFSLSAAIDMFPGAALDAGKSLTVRGTPGSRAALLQNGARNFLEIIGGHAPNPAAKELPAYLIPGSEYIVTASGGSDVPHFETKVRAPEPIVWTNRAGAGEADRSRGMTVEWRASARDSLVEILVMNSDSRSGEMGGCVCTASASSGTFAIPPYALANIPPTPARPRGLPLNLVFLIALPQPEALPAGVPGLAHVTALGASVSGRTVRFR